MGFEPPSPPNPDAGPHPKPEPLDLSAEEEEVSRRRRAVEAQRVGREDLVINLPNVGTGLSIPEPPDTPTPRRDTSLM